MRLEQSESLVSLQTPGREETNSQMYISIYDACTSTTFTFSNFSEHHVVFIVPGLRSDLYWHKARFVTDVSQAMKEGPKNCWEVAKLHAHELGGGSRVQRENVKESPAV